MASRRIEVEIIGDPRSVEAAFGRAMTASQKFQRGLAPVARGAKIALLGVGALGVASVKLANDFNRTSSQMVGLAGVGEKQVERWKDSLLDLAPVVGKTPRELAEALYFVASSGVPAAKALDAVKVSAMGATGGLGDTEVVADAITSAMNAYADANLTAAQAGDVLAATVREGKGEAAAIAPVLGNILPIASQLGVGFEEVGAAMASMTRLGFDAATAATNLSGVFNGLLKPSVQAQDEMKKLGTSAGELQEMLGEKGLLPTLEFLREKFDGNNAAMARVFPNVRALRGVLSLVGKAGDDTADVFKRMEDNTGALGHAFQSVDDDALAMDQAMASLQASGIRLGNEVAPAVASLASSFADGAEFAGQHAQATKGAAIAIAGLSVAVIGANSALKIYNSELVKVIGAQGALRGALAATPWIALGAAIALAVHEGLQQFADYLDDTPEKLDAAASAARNYKSALDDLNSAGDELADARSRREHAEINEIRTQHEARAAVEQYGRKSIEAREAILNHKDALRELERAQKGVSDAVQKGVTAGVNARANAKKTTTAINDLSDKLSGVTRQFDRSNEANATLLSQLEPATVQNFATKVRALAKEAGGMTTEVGRDAIAVADLTVKLGRIPTRTEIKLVTNADHTRDQIENLRAAVDRVPTVHTITFNIQTHGSINTPTGLAEGAGAAGAVIRRPTLALVGERGPEALMPLDRTRGNGPLSSLAGGGTTSIVVNLPNYRGDDVEIERIMRKAMGRVYRRGASPGAGRL